jgi:hypothetical protein
MKRIISYSLWGKDTFYTDGAIRNLSERLEFYPDWTCRFYYDSTVPIGVVNQLRAGGAELVKMRDSFDALGMFWRFRPMFDDPDVERFIVRDTDSGFSRREVDAVNYWIESGKSFHFIRDCESHNVPICGGMWGSVAGAVPDMEKRICYYLQNVTPQTNNPRGCYHGADQLFLGKTVWAAAQNDHIAHIRAGLPKLRFNDNDIELPPLVEGERYVGMVC